MDIKVKVDAGGYMPEKAHNSDAGFDLRTPIDTYIAPLGSVTIDTKVHMVIPDGYAGVIISKSGLNMKHDLTSTGLVDAGYTGTIQVKLYNNGDHLHSFNKGDKISQIMIVPIPEVKLIKTESLEETERGANGFGSSGR